MKPPFVVRRTGSNNLPVWREPRQNNTLMSTMVGKIRGDSFPLRRDLRILTHSEVEDIGSGKLRIRGDHYVLVKKYLQSIGLYGWLVV